MQTEIERLLATELGRLGGPGARLVARWLPSNVGEQRVALRLAPESLRTRVQALLAALGTPVVLAAGEEAAGLSVLTGSGRLRLNPTLVTGWLTPVSEQQEHQTWARIRAVAKEGLIKQRGGEQLAGEVAMALQQLDEPLT